MRTTEVTHFSQSLEETKGDLEAARAQLAATQQLSRKTADSLAAQVTKLQGDLVAERSERHHLGKEVARLQQEGKEVKLRASGGAGGGRAQRARGPEGQGSMEVSAWIRGYGKGRAKCGGMVRLAGHGEEMGREEGRRAWGWEGEG